MALQTLLTQIAALAQKELAPIVQDIDRKGVYPEQFMRELGKIGGATAFSVWCQAACAWYLHKTPNAAVKTRYLADVLQGKVLAGTGMSNTVKHLAGIEGHNLRAEKTEGGYRVNGVLPWVSNLGDTHIWANTAAVDGGYVMFITGAQREGVTLNPCPEFCALEGTRTFALKFENAFVPDEDVLAQPEQFPAYIKAIQGGMILLQIGIGAGIIDGCLTEIAHANIGSETNIYLNNQAEDLQTRYTAVLDKTVKLANEEWQGGAGILEILRTRLSAAELALDAAQSAALHAGAKGYLMRSPVQRRVREAMFVAIVTPATKHLRKEISELEFTGEFSI